jgi:hypothetical protein
VGSLRRRAAAPVAGGQPEPAVNVA